MPSPLLTAALAERYTIERELGRGGMATVYLAEKREHARQVAIKVLHAELAASMGAERFLPEIGIVARLSHQGVLEAIQYFERAIAEDPQYALAYTGLSDAATRTPEGWSGAGRARRRLPARTTSPGSSTGGAQRIGRGRT